MIKTEEVLTELAVNGGSSLISPRLAERVFQLDRSIITTGRMASMPHTAWAVYATLGVLAKYPKPDEDAKRTCYPSYGTITRLSGVANPRRPCKALKKAGLIDMKWRRYTSNLYTILPQYYGEGDFIEFGGELLYNENVGFTWAPLTHSAKALYLVLRAKIHNNSFRLFYSTDFARYFDMFLREWWFNEYRQDIEEYFRYLIEEVRSYDPDLLKTYHTDIIRPYIELTETVKRTYGELAGINDIRTFGKALNDLTGNGLTKIFNDDVYGEEYVWPLPNTYAWAY
jgi:hypothetical protein